MGEKRGNIKRGEYVLPFIQVKMWDNILRILGIQDTLIVYFNYADQPAVNVLKKHFGIRAKVVKLEPEANVLPPEVNQYPLVIVVAPKTNPIVERLIKMKALQKFYGTSALGLRKFNGIFALGNTIFIIGKDPLDTFELVSQYIRREAYFKGEDSSSPLIGKDDIN